MIPAVVQRGAATICVFAAVAALSAQDPSRLAPSALPPAERPFGTLREQAALQQEWLKKRLDTFLPALMRKHGIDMWVVPMREYNEDPVFSSIISPETFAARRRTIYVFFDSCAASGAPPAAVCVERIALGGTSQGGVFDARTLDQGGGGQCRSAASQAELWGDEQWQAAQGGRRRAQAEGDRHRSLDGVRIQRRSVERRAEGHDARRSARRWTREVPATPKGCRSTSSRRGCRKKKRSSRR